MWSTGIDAYFAMAKVLPDLYEKLSVHRPVLRDVDMSHLEVGLKGWFDERYLRSFERKCEVEMRIGLSDARTSITLYNTVVQGVVARSFLSSFRNADRLKVLNAAIAFDGITAIAATMQDLTRTIEARRAAIDLAISNFNTTVTAMLSALGDTSTSLKTTSETMRRVTRDTVERAKSASAASVETSREPAY